MAANVSVELNGQYSLGRGRFETSTMVLLRLNFLHEVGLNLLTVLLFSLR